MKIKTYALQVSDSGRVAGERRDCTVRCHSNFFGLPYSECHAILAAAGRKWGKGFYYAQWLDRNHRELKKINPHQTIATFLHSGAGRSGKWIIFVRGHVFCSVDGKAIDTGYCRPGMRVIAAYYLPESVNTTQVKQTWVLIINEKPAFEYDTQEKAESMMRAFKLLGNNVRIESR